jgi:hypothetical protein
MVGPTDDVFKISVVTRKPTATDTKLTAHRTEAIIRAVLTP